MKTFAEWLSTTVPSVFIQDHYAWLIPAIQSVHIVGITMLAGAVFMLSLRVLGLAGMDQSLQDAERRYGAWLPPSLWLLLATGLLMVVGEPRRELLTFSFWLKMALVAVGAALAMAFRSRLRQPEQRWEDRLDQSPAVRLLALLTLVLWAFIIVLGRLIAYDHVWGSWSQWAA